MTYLIRRFASAYFDAVVAAIFILFYTVLLGSLKGQKLDNMESPSANYWLLLQIIFTFLYYLISEFLFGKTLGKVIFKFRINGLVQERGLKRLWQVVKRTIFRYVPFEPFSILLNEDRRMWHDKFSKTIVVDKRKP